MNAIFSPGANQPPLARRRLPTLGLLITSLLCAERTSAQIEDPHPVPGVPLVLTHETHLTGNWGGLRNRLFEDGVHIELIYQSEYFANTRGGITTDGASEYRGDLSLFLELHTGKVGWWDSGTFFAHVQSQHGNGITDDFVGDFQVLSNIDADDFTQLSELWYRHSFDDDRVWLKLGKQETNADFAFVEHGVEFILSSPGFSPTIPLVTFPDPDWGLSAGVTVTDWLSVNAGIFQGRPDGGRSLAKTLDNLYGPMVMLEPTVHYQWRGELGHLRIGGWWNGDRFDELDESNPSPGTFGENYGGYVTLEQGVWSVEDGASIGVFGQYGWSPEDRNEAAQYIGAGIFCSGVVPGRDDDSFGLGVFHVALSDEGGFAEGEETAVELFYKAQLTGWLSIKPDVQYISNPGGTTNDDAVAVGIRFELIL